MHTYETNGKMKMKKLMPILSILVSTFVTFCVGCETSNVKEVQALQFVRDELSNKVLALTRENAELSQKVKALEGDSTAVAQEQTKAPSEKARDAKAREEEAAQRPVEQEAAPSKSPEERRAQIYDAFLESIRTCGNGTMFSEVATKDTMLVVVVTEEWNYAIYPARLEHARQMWRTWAALRSPNDMNSALLIMLDEYGSKVGGSRGLGSEIWVRRD